jgi:hypothetical protein
MSDERERWTRRGAFVMAAIGSAWHAGLALVSLSGGRIVCLRIAGHGRAKA